MAVVKIGNIVTTVAQAIRYAKENKIVKIENDLKDDVADCINYAIRVKTDTHYIYETVSSSLNCSLLDTNAEWTTVRKYYGKDSGNLAFHVKQNFGLEIDPQIANEIGMKLANELFGDFQCIISTHTNTPYTHNHIVFNAVSFKNGKRYYDNNATYKKIRQVSDRLCKEYGLPVLEDTKDYNLVKYKDSDGKTKFFEPTERKSKLENQKVSKTDDYRNTSSYQKLDQRKQSNRDRIKSDIDMIIPNVNSYEELLIKLKQKGYSIKSKKADGDWLKHISFKAPNQDKYLRDYKLDDSESYTRENLIQRISNNRIIDNDLGTAIQSNSIVNDYSLFEIHTAENDADFKYKHEKINDVNEDRRFNGKPRIDVEKMIVKDAKQLNKMLDAEYWDAIKFRKEKDEPILTNSKYQYYLDCINANLRTMQFVEKNDINSFSDLSHGVNRLIDKKNTVLNELNKIKGRLKIANENIVLIDKYKQLKSEIDLKRSSAKFNESMIVDDLMLLQSYKSVLEKRKIWDEDSQIKYKEIIIQYNDAYLKLSESTRQINIKIQEYDQCINTIKRVDYTKRYAIDLDYYNANRKKYNANSKSIETEREESKNSNNKNTKDLGR